jgi:outer membrane protein
MLNKAVKNAAVILLGSLMLLGNASAKDQKIAIVDVQAIAAQMPQMATIQETVQAEFKNQVEVLQKLQADAKYNYDKLQREGATMSDAQKEELRTTIMGQQKTLEEKSKPLQQAMQRRGQEEQNKVMALVAQAIDKVAKDGNYDFVLRRESLAYASEADKKDISAKVLEQAKKAK